MDDVHENARRRSLTSNKRAWQVDAAVAAAQKPVVVVVVVVVGAGEKHPFDISRKDSPMTLCM